MNELKKSNDTPKLVFPCDYPIKVIGVATSDFKQFVTQVVKQHFPDFDEATISVRESEHSNYQSIAITILIQEESQIYPLFLELKADDRVKLVL